MLGVRFILENGGGQVISIAAYRVLAERDRRYLFEVLFDYGDLDRSGDPYVPADQGAELATRDWPIRPDPFSSWRAGFEVRTLRRCERVLMVHHFRELGGVIIVASATFTLARMNHTNELTAMMSSGVSLHRVVWPIVLCSMLMGGLILIDSELVISRPGVALKKKRWRILQTTKTARALSPTRP